MLSCVAMFSLMHVTQGADRLVLSYPLWIACALLIAAGAFLGYGVLRRSRRRWTMGLATLVAAWAGLYFATFNATFTGESGSVYGFLRYDQRMQWKDAADIYLEQRGGPRDWYVVVVDRKRRIFDFNVADLSIEDRDRVMAYMVDRMPESVFRGEPALMKRHGAVGARRVGLFADQQI